MVMPLLYLFRDDLAELETCHDIDLCVPTSKVQLLSRKVIISASILLENKEIQGLGIH